MPLVCRPCFGPLQEEMAILLTGGGEMRSPEALKPRETHRTPNWPGAELSMETIRAYLADLSGRGRRKGTVMSHIARLREKMHEPSRKPKFIKTVWGVGYTIE